MWSRRKKGADEGLAVYMDPIEFSQLLAIVEALAPRRVLEWGSGGSTKALLERCPFIERYVSVEHVRSWRDKVLTHVTDPRLELLLAEPDLPLPPGEHSRRETIAWEATGETDPAVFASYVAFPATLDTRFELVLVDGRARCFCLAAGFELLEPGGVIVLHDAQREAYHGALARLGRPIFLEPWKAGQICLVRKP